MRRILLALGLATLAGCVTTPDYRYVSGNGGYYTSDDGGYYAGGDGWYGNGTSYWSSTWNMSFRGSYGYGAFWPSYGWYPGYASYWSYWPYFTPYYIAYVPRHHRDRYRDRDGLSRERVLQAGSASATPTRMVPRTAVGVRREAWRSYPSPSTMARPVHGRDMRRTIPRGTPRSAPVMVPRSAPAPRIVPRSRPSAPQARPLRRAATVPVSRAPVPSHAVAPRGTTSSKSRRSH